MTDLWPRLERLLAHVERPARYLDHEWGCVRKAQADFAFCMVYPDTYELGQANQAVRILTNVVDATEHLRAERAFLPAVDLIDLMREDGLPLFSLESCAPVREFDVVGITLPHELAATNVLETLDLAGIPLRAEDRGEDDPFVLGGGPCAFNPEPYAPFFDAVLVGEGEESVPEALLEVRRLRAQGASRHDVLRALALLPGCYVPSLYRWRDEAWAQEAGVWIEPLEAGLPTRIEKRLFAGFAESPGWEPCIVPYTEVVHDRLNVEVLRGCARGCRFCQAGMMYRPVRERWADNVVASVMQGLAETGYDEVSLTSLSSTDHSQIAEILTRLNRSCDGKGIRISVPSQRLDAFGVDMAGLVAGQKKGGLTFAPEAGTQRLRDVINKGVTEEDLMSKVSDAFHGGWSSVKLYFMMGLPTETTEDLDGIADLAKKVVDAYFAVPRGERAKGLRVVCSASVFVPKPFTPFQWEPQDTQEMVREKQSHLREKLHIKGVTFNYHESDLSYLEACFARGDRRMGQVLLRAYQKGCMLDGWTELFKYDMWREAFAELGIDPAFYAYRRREKDEIMPWDVIDCGVTKEFLWREKEKAEKAQTTKDCRKGCNGCGLQRFKGVCKYCG